MSISKEMTTKRVLRVEADVAKSTAEGVPAVDFEVVVVVEGGDECDEFVDGGGGAGPGEDRGVEFGGGVEEIRDHGASFDAEVSGETSAGGRD